MHVHLRTVAGLLAVIALLQWPARAAAQDFAPFPSRSELSLVARPFSDREVETLLATLDGLLAREIDPVKWDGSAATAIGGFVRHLQTGRLTASQERQVTRHLEGIAAARPGVADTVGRSRRLVTAFMPGKPAPEIAGKDLDGVDLRLSEYRGKVVVLVFTAEWCGICRTLNPYERFMLELYGNWPFAILSVETGSSPDAAKKAKALERLSYRSWWDAVPASGGPGRIASAWNVAGYPSVYVLDAKGVIRFVDVRYEDLLKAVRQLLMEG
jgi:thiol-disulfide isomerase/thioredoxin